MTLRTNARIIAATNRTLAELVGRGTFREDLFHRLNVVKIERPPLVRRREDIPLLMRYNFPGNIRELENIIEFAFLLCRGDTIRTRHLSREIQELSQNSRDQEPETSTSLLDHAEKNAILAALQRHNANRGRTAEFLGINKSTLWRKMKKYGITF